MRFQDTIYHLVWISHEEDLVSLEGSIHFILGQQLYYTIPYVASLHSHSFVLYIQHPVQRCRNVSLLHEEKNIRKHVSIIMFARRHLMIYLMSSAIDCPEQ